MGVLQTNSLHSTIDISQEKKIEYVVFELPSRPLKRKMNLNNYLYLSDQVPI